MISSLTQLEGALRQIAWAADSLEGLRRDVNPENAVLFPVVSEAYLHQIRSMAAQAQAHLRAQQPAASGGDTPPPPGEVAETAASLQKAA